LPDALLEAHGPRSWPEAGSSHAGDAD
jgi:hypothetical protein